MISTSITLVICIFVAAAIPTGYGHPDSTTGSDREARISILATDNLESSTTEPVLEIKETSPVDLGALLDADPGPGAMVTLVAGDTRLLAHRAVLAARSPVFAAMPRHEAPQVSGAVVTLPDVEGGVLRQLVSYCYTLRAPHLPDEVPQLLAAADRYGLPGLKAACEQQVAARLSVETAAATAVLAVRHSSAVLRQAAVAFIRAHIFHVMATRGWADAILRQPRDMTQVMQLLSEPTAEASVPDLTDSRAYPHSTTQPHSGDHSSQGQTPATAAPTKAASCQTAPPDEAAVSRLRGIYAEQKGSRLIVAAQDGAVEELEALLSVGADVGATDAMNQTALHWAADMGHVEVARRLLCRGAEVDARASWQWTPLHIAARDGHTAVVRLLLEKGADHSARKSDGWTPLHLAAFNGNREAAAALLESGADRGARDNWGYTPLDLARQELVDLLRGT